MSGKLIGYVRVSSELQNTDRQLDGIKLDKLYTDKLSGKTLKRPALEQMLDYARDGDIVVVHSMDRLARNLDDLRNIVKRLTNKQVKIRFIKESLEFTGDDSPMSNLLLSVMGAFAEFERNLIKERQTEGIALAKKRGAFKGRKRSLSREQQDALIREARNGCSKTKIADRFGINRSTVYEYLKI